MVQLIVGYFIAPIHNVQGRIIFSNMHKASPPPLILGSGCVQLTIEIFLNGFGAMHSIHAKVSVGMGCKVRTIDLIYFIYLIYLSPISSILSIFYLPHFSHLLHLSCRSYLFYLSYLSKLFYNRFFFFYDVINCESFSLYRFPQRSFVHWSFFFLKWQDNCIISLCILLFLFLGSLFVLLFYCHLLLL